MAFFRDLTALLRFSGFRRLFAVRLLSQASDGIFQVALASTVLFSPERAPSAGAIAVAFAAILLPFTILGPFLGVFLDRWSQRRILMASNAIRVTSLLVIALLVMGDNVGWLFYLLVLSGLTHVRHAGLSLRTGLRRCGSRCLAQRRHCPGRRRHVLLPVCSP